MGIELVSSGEKIPSLGRTLFVSENGSTTLTRAQALGKINKPLSLQRAFDVCQDRDRIFIFSGNFPSTYTLNSKSYINIHYENSDFSFVDRIQQITFNNCSDITITGNGINSSVGWLFFNNHSSNIIINNLFIVYQLNINTSNHVVVSVKNCILQAYNITGGAGSRCDISECMIYSNLDAISTNFYIHVFMTKTRKSIARVNSGEIVFENCILGEGLSDYNKFDSLTGSLGLTQISYKNCVIHNVSNALCDSTNPNITRLEVQNCVLRQHVTTGRIPDAYNGVIVDASLIPGYFL